MKSRMHWVIGSMIVSCCLRCAPAPNGGGDAPGGNDNSDGGGNGGDSVVPETTKVLSSSTLDRLSSVSADLATFTFSGNTDQLVGIQAGDILASGVSEPHLPYGALRKVVGVTTSGDQTIVTTEGTGLAQAIERGSLHARIPLTAEGAGQGGKGATLLQGPGQILMPINDIVLHDCDQIDATTNDRVILNGTMTLDPEIIIDFDFAGFALERAAVEVVGTATVTLAIESNCKASLNHEELLQSVPFPKVVIPIGPVPVVLVPILEIYGGASGTFSSGMETDITLEGDLAVGLEYEGGPSPVFEVEPSGDVGIPSFDEAAVADGKVWISARFKVGVYGVAGLYVDSQFFGRVHVNSSECPWWVLYGGILGKAGAFLEISVGLFGYNIDITIIDWDTPALEEEVELADAGGCAPGQPVDISTWAHTYGGDSIDFPVALALASDSGVVVGGSTYSDSQGSFHPEATLYKVDSFGNLVWQVGYHDLITTVAVEPIPGGYYLLAGEISEQTDEPSYLLRLNATGVPLWAKSLNHASLPLDAVSLAVLPGGDVVVSGNIDDYAVANIWAARFDPNGNAVWSKELGGDLHDHVKSMLVDSAGDIVVLAESTSFAESSQFGCFWTVKLNEEGDVVWQYCYNGPHVDFAGEIVEVPGGYTLIGDLAQDAELNHIDFDGHLVFARHFDADTLYDKGYSAAVLADGTIVVVGRRELGDAADVWAFRINDEGDVLWSRSYGGMANDEAGGFNQYSSLGQAVLATPDGGIVIAGHTESFGAGNMDNWLLKIRDVGTIEFSAGSGATDGPVSGIAGDVSHTTTTPSATPQSLSLIVSDFDAQHYNTAWQVSTQSTSP